MWSSRSASLTCGRSLPPVRRRRRSGGVAHEGLALAAGEQFERRALDRGLAAPARSSRRVSVFSSTSWRNATARASSGTAAATRSACSLSSASVPCQLVVVAVSGDVSPNRLVHHWPPVCGKPSTPASWGRRSVAPLSDAVTSNSSPPERNDLTHEKAPPRGASRQWDCSKNVARPVAAGLAPRRCADHFGCAAVERASTRFAG
jgi:hypothetical protein